MKACVQDCGVRETSRREIWKLTEAAKNQVIVLVTPEPPIPLLCLLASGPWALGTVSNGECLLMNRAAPILLELAT